MKSWKNEGNDYLGANDCAHCSYSLILGCLKYSSTKTKITNVDACACMVPGFTEFWILIAEILGYFVNNGTCAHGRTVEICISFDVFICINSIFQFEHQHVWDVMANFLLSIFTQIKMQYLIFRCSRSTCAPLTIKVAYKDRATAFLTEIFRKFAKLLG